MPGAAVGILVGIGRRGQRAVHGTALVGCRAAIHRGPHEWVEERDAAVESEQSGGLGRRRRLGTNPQLRASAPQQRRVADRLSGRREHKPPRVGRELLEALAEARLDPARQRRSRQCEATGEVGRGRPARELEQRQRIATRFGEDPLAHVLVELAVHDRAEQHAGVVLVQTLDDQLG
jgi:hypothetical protein